MPTSDFGQKLGIALKAINLSRGRLAQTVGVDKSVVSRWVSGVQAPTDHNLTLLTEAIGRHVPGFSRVDWELACEAFATRLGLRENSLAGQPVLALPDRPSIAVLAFENMSGDPEQAYFADGLAEDLIAGLSRVSWLFVIARNSSFVFRGEKLEARSIGQRLGVRYLVEGSVRREVQRLRVTVQLIEAATGNHLWVDRYDGSLENVFDFQDRIVASLVGTIEPKLRATEIARARRKRPDSLDAFDLFLQALPKAAVMSAQSLAEAIELLDRAVALSPNYAQALGYAAHSSGPDFLSLFPPPTKNRLQTLADGEEGMAAKSMAWKFRTKLRSQELWRQTGLERPDMPQAGSRQSGTLAEKPAAIGVFRARPERERQFA